jgi:hypothetical protein
VTPRLLVIYADGTTDTVSARSEIDYSRPIVAMREIQ